MDSARERLLITRSSRWKRLSVARRMLGRILLVLGWYLRWVLYNCCHRRLALCRLELTWIMIRHFLYLSFSTWVGFLTASTVHNLEADQSAGSNRVPSSLHFASPARAKPMLYTLPDTLTFVP